jgi:hypothetical protein
MAQLRIDQHSGTPMLVLQLTTAEKVAGLHGDITVPLSSVTSVEVVEDAVAATRGLRAPGLALPGSKKIGTWRGRDGKAFVVARRGVPAVRVELAGQDYRRLLVSTPDAVDVAARIGAGRA